MVVRAMETGLARTRDETRVPRREARAVGWEVEASIVRNSAARGARVAGKAVGAPGPADSGPRRLAPALARASTTPIDRERVARLPWWLRCWSFEVLERL